MMGREEGEVALRVALCGVASHMVGREEGVAAVGVGVLNRDKI